MHTRLPQWQLSEKHKTPGGRVSEPAVTSDFEAEIVELYQRYVESIYCFCLCRLYAKDLAEEATSEVFFKLVRQYPTLRKNDQKKKTETHIRNWLYGTARNAIAGQIRHAKRRQEILQGIARGRENLIAGPTESERQTEFEDVYKAIGKLNAQDQEIVVHRYLKGFPSSDIAARMGMEHGTVRVRLSRAIRTLRKILRTGHV